MHVTIGSLILRRILNRIRTIRALPRLRCRHKASRLHTPFHVKAIVDLIHHVRTLTLQDDRRSKRALQRVVHVGQLIRLAGTRGDARVGEDLRVTESATNQPTRGEKNEKQRTRT